MANVLERVRRYASAGDIVLLLVAVVSGLISPYYAFLLTSVVITSLLCLSVGVTTERAGVISLCQVAMAGVGAWVANWVLLHAPVLGVAGALLAAAVVSGLVAVIVALPSLRVRGVQLAIVTLAFSLVANLVLTRVGFPGVDDGLSYMRSGWLESDAHLLSFCAVLAVVVSRVLVSLESLPFGAAWFGVKFSERAVAAFGVNVPWVKVSAFTVGAVVAGLAGGLMVLQLGVLSARNFEPMSSLVIFALAVLSRSRFMTGALVAAVLTWFTPELLSAVGLGEWKDLGDLIFALGALHALHGRAHTGVAAAAAPSDASQAELAPAPAFKTPLPVAARPADLVLDQLTVCYGATKALSEASLHVKSGRVTGLVGPNGAGKSTLVDAISGFTASVGGIALDGQSIASLSAQHRARQGLRRTFQVGRAIPELTIAQYLRLGSHTVHDNGHVTALLDWLACPGPDTPIESLDVGTRRLIELAAALLSKPRLLLLDEPAAGMSARESRRLGQVIQRIPAVFGCTVLLIEHDLSLIREVCSDLIVLEFGKVIANGPVHDTLALPHVVDAYIGAAA
jgi:branched-chain amino acid transport system permease protein